jgi:hypothetical protein
MFPGFDGLLTLSRREGVDVRPTLLRVLTDLYVQAPNHTIDEEKQFVELTARLIDQVDDATRAAVRARLSIYPNTPRAILNRLNLRPTEPGQSVPLAQPISAAESPAPTVKQPSEAQMRVAANMAMAPRDASEISTLFFAASSSERAQILHNLAETPLRSSARIPQARAARAMHILEMAAFAEDRDNFARELSEALMLPAAIAEQVVSDPGGEPLACCAKALGMRSDIFQRVLLFLNPEFGTSVTNVYRIARMYDVLSERSALIMVAAWRGAHMAATRAKFRPALYDDERHRARPSAPQARPSVQPGVHARDAEFVGALERPDFCTRNTRDAGIRRKTALGPSPIRENAVRPCPSPSPVSTIQTSGSNEISFCKRSSILRSSTGCGGETLRRRDRQGGSRHRRFAAPACRASRCHPAARP